jgi:hypothetical protein
MPNVPTDPTNSKEILRINGERRGSDTFHRMLTLNTDGGDPDQLRIYLRVSHDPAGEGFGMLLNPTEVLALVIECENWLARLLTENGPPVLTGVANAQGIIEDIKEYDG